MNHQKWNLIEKVRFHFPSKQFAKPYCAMYIFTVIILIIFSCDIDECWRKSFIQNSTHVELHKLSSSSFFMFRVKNFGVVRWRERRKLTDPIRFHNKFLSASFLSCASFYHRKLIVHCKREENSSILFTLVINHLRSREQ